MHEPDRITENPLNILLVEDSPTDVKITLRAFQSAQIKNTFFSVHDGQGALDFIYHQGEYQDEQKFPRPDLILLDINLPKVDGFTVLQRIKEDKQFCQIPMVMLTSSKNQQDILKCYQYGASGYIQKSVSYDTFCGIVEIFNKYWHHVSRVPE